MPEYDYIISGYKVIANFLANKFNLREKEVYSQLIKLFEISSKNVFNRLLEQYGIPYTKNEILELVDIYRNHSPNVNPYEDVYDNLKIYREKGYMLGIITDGFKIAQKKKLSRLNLRDFIDFIVVTDEYGKDYWKPNPKPFEMIKEHFGVKYNEIMYIGDNPTKDFYIQETFPITTVRIYRENAIHHQEAYLNDVHESIAIENLKELTIILEEKGKL